MVLLTTVFHRTVMMLCRSLGVTAAVLAGSLGVMVILSGFNTPG